MLRGTFTNMPALIHNQALAKSGGASSVVPWVGENGELASSEIEKFGRACF
jgi:hypothetical protein